VARIALSVNNPYCRIAEPYRTDFRGLASYLVPKVDVQVAATWASIPRGLVAGRLHADRCRSGDGSRTDRSKLTGAFNTVNLIAPATLWGARQNNVDLRIAKLLRFGTTRTLVGVDIFNC
jgi:hypothetical protein